MKAKPTHERFQLVVEALPDEVPANIRLRTFLKRALRSFGIRCVSISEVPPATLTDGADVQPTESAEGAIVSDPLKL
jgi:hypothetical protein